MLNLPGCSSNAAANVLPGGYLSLELSAKKEGGEGIGIKASQRIPRATYPWELLPVSVLVSVWSKHAFCTQTSSHPTCAATFPMTQVLILDFIAWLYFSGCFQNVSQDFWKSWQMLSLTQLLDTGANSEQQVICHFPMARVKTEHGPCVAQQFWFRAEVRQVLPPGHQHPSHLETCPTPAAGTHLHNMECCQSRDAALQGRRAVFAVHCVIASSFPASRMHWGRQEMQQSPFGDNRGIAWVYVLIWTHHWAKWSCGKKFIWVVCFTSMNRLNFKSL